MSLISRIKAEIDLKQYLENQEGKTFNGSKTLCPFHNDKNPSMDVNFKDGIWLWHCHSCGAGGDIISYLEKKHGFGISGAIQILKPFVTCESPRSKRIEYIYRDADGVEVCKKVKKLDSYGNKEYYIFHKLNGAWKKGKGGHDSIPYNLDKFDKFGDLIICEGEKDADTINALNYDLLATSAPFGQNSWSDSLTKYFEGKRAAYFLYDVGSEKSVEKHASKIKASLPELTICIAHVPMKNREDDITDYLDLFSDAETKRQKLDEIICAAEPFDEGHTIEERGFERIFVGTLEDFMEASIPEIERLIDPYVFRGGLTEIGGVKGAHKSFFATQMVLQYCSGISPFLSARIEKPGKALLIQQEISMGFMRKRLYRMTESASFISDGRFFPITTTAKQLKLLEEKDYEVIRRWIEQYEPDILVLDPLSTFNTSEENTSKDMARFVNRLSEIKANFNLGLVITHHFSSKRNINDPAAPSEAGGWFRGHTVLSDAADVLICLHRLPGQRDNPNLPLPYEDYNLVEISLRNERRPDKFAIEFDEDTFLLEQSDVWQEIGKKIMPNQIEELLEANDGSMLQKDVVGHFSHTARPTTVRRAISEAVRQNKIEKEILEGRGTPVLLKLSAN